MFIRPSNVRNRLVRVDCKAKGVICFCTPTWIWQFGCSSRPSFFWWTVLKIEASEAWISTLSVEFDCDVFLFAINSSSSFFLSGLISLSLCHPQVNSLIHGPHSPSPSVASDATTSYLDEERRTDSGRPRSLPAGAVFETSGRTETSVTNPFAPGPFLLKLADDSGWAILPRPDAAEEIGIAVVGGDPSVWLRVLPRAGDQCMALPSYESLYFRNESVFLRCRGIDFFHLLWIK